MMNQTAIDEVDEVDALLGPARPVISDDGLFCLVHLPQVTWDSWDIGQLIVHEGIGFGAVWMTLQENLLLVWDVYEDDAPLDDEPWHPADDPRHLTSSRLGFPVGL